MKTSLINENFRNNYILNLLKSRGLSEEDYEKFKNPTKDLLQNPFDLDNIKEGIKLLQDTLALTNPRLLLIVDCDVDGFTSSAIIYQFIRKLRPEQKIDVILHEHKAHGLEDVCDEILEREKYDLIILPDSSSNDYIYHEQLREVGTKCLILDHHDIENTPISSNAIIINNQLSEHYRNKELTGAGVTWQFCRAYSLTIGQENLADDLIDLAALGICGDMGSVLELENRYIMTEGFSHIKNYFFKCAIDKQSFSMGGEINPTTVAFYIVPLINALIRVGTMEEKQRLFKGLVDGHFQVPSGKRGAKGTYEEVAIESLRECTNAKSKQTRITDQMVEKLEAKIYKYDLLENKILFIRLDDDDDFPAEINGLIAMKMAARFKRPTLITRLNKEGYDRGSIRNVADCELTDLKAFLNESGYFEYVQGHPNAAGASILDKNLRDFHAYANEKLKDIDFSEGFYKVNFERFASDHDLKELIYALGAHPEIWGQGNQEPLISIQSIQINSNQIRIMGKNNDTIKIEKNGISYIKFHAQDMIKDLENRGDISINLVGKANLNEWGGNITPQIFIEAYEIVDNLLSF